MELSDPGAHTGRWAKRALVALPVNSGILDSVQEVTDRVQEECFQSQQVECPKPGAMKACHWQWHFRLYVVCPSGLCES